MLTIDLNVEQTNELEEKGFIVIDDRLIVTKIEKNRYVVSKITDECFEINLEQEEYNIKYED